jgi:hypothetical protein
MGIIDQVEAAGQSSKHDGGRAEPHSPGKPAAAAAPQGHYAFAKHGSLDEVQGLHGNPSISDHIAEQFRAPVSCEQHDKPVRQSAACGRHAAGRRPATD